MTASERHALMNEIDAATSAHEAEAEAAPRPD
jgi:hypothetical protein